MGFFQEFTENVQDYVLGVIKKEKKGRFVPIVRFLLHCFSWFFGLGSQLRLYFYKSGLFKSKSLGCMIVSIGNITVGGTGKTPTVELFAKALQNNGRKVAIISRGYRSSTRFGIKRFIKKLLLLIPKDQQIKVVSDGKKIYLNSSMAGDEPYMLAKKLPGIVVAIDKDRAKAGEYVIEKYGIDTILLDDGYQHLSLNPRFDVVLVDTTNPFGNKKLLPSGILREPIENLNRANLFILTKSSKNKDLSELKASIRQHNYSANFIECRHKAIEFVNLKDNSTATLESFKGNRIGLISAIADPASFEKAIGELGLNIVLTKRFQDHHRFSVKEIRSVLKFGSRKNISAIITTEKDAVRFPELSSTRGIPIYFLKVEMEILNGMQDFQECISKLCFQ